jgi:single-strand DNA-binding protein
MAAFNKFIVLGNLTRDPEVRTTANGAVICKVGIASTRVFNGADGAKREETLFLDADAFGRQAEVMGKFLKKGVPVLLEGRLRLDQWETPAGERRSKHILVVENFQFIGSRSQDDSHAAETDAVGSDFEAHSSRRPAAPAAIAPDVSDDVPF